MSPPGSWGISGAMPGRSIIQQAKILLSSSPCHTDATTWHREGAGRGCWCPRPPAHPGTAILGHPGLPGTDRRWGVVCRHPGQELNGNNPCRHSRMGANPFPWVLHLHLRGQHGSRDTHGSWTVSPGPGLMARWGPAAPRQHRQHPPGHTKSSQAKSRGQPPTREGRLDTCAGRVGEKTVNAERGACVCWAVKATPSPQLTKTLPKRFRNANTC